MHTGSLLDASPGARHNQCQRDEATLFLCRRLYRELLLVFLLVLRENENSGLSTDAAFLQQFDRRRPTKQQSSSVKGGLFCLPLF
jgi:hypothetical protein